VGIIIRNLIRRVAAAVEKSVKAKIIGDLEEEKMKHIFNHS
jgi:hypothetical protein